MRRSSRPPTSSTRDDRAARRRPPRPGRARCAGTGCARRPRTVRRCASVPCATRRSPQAERLDGAGARGGRGQAVGQLRVGRALGAGTPCGPGAGTSGWPTRSTGSPASADQRRAAGQQERPRRTSSALDGGDQHLGHRVAQRDADRASTSTVLRAARSPVPARSTTAAGRPSARSTNSSRSRASGPLAEAVPERSGRSGSAGPGRRRSRTIARASRSTVPTPAPPADGVDDPAQQPRGGQPGDRGQRVQHQHERDRAPVAADQARARPGGPRAGRRPAGRSSDGLDVGGVVRPAARGRPGRGSRARRPAVAVRAGRRRPGRRPGSAPCRPGRAAAATWSSTTVVRPAARPAQPVRDAGLGVRVHRRGRVDQEQHLRVGEQGPGQPDPLPLPAGEVAARVADGRVEPVGERATTSCGRRRVQRRARPVVVDGRRGPARISPQRPGEEVRRRGRRPGSGRGPRRARCSVSGTPAPGRVARRRTGRAGRPGRPRRPGRRRRRRSAGRRRPAARSPGRAAAGPAGPARAAGPPHRVVAGEPAAGRRSAGRRPGPG